MIKHFYLPVYAHRAFAGNQTALTKIIDTLAEGRRIIVYTDLYQAQEVARNMLSDDDTTNIIEIFFDGISNYTLNEVRGYQRKQYLESFVLYSRLDFIETKGQEFLDRLEIM